MYLHGCMYSNSTELFLLFECFIYYKNVGEQQRKLEEKRQQTQLETQRQQEVCIFYVMLR